MNDMPRETLDEYYASAESWSEDRVRAENRSRRNAWIVAGVAALIALLEAVALIALIPLKREVPYTLLVDKETGYVQALHPLESSKLSADAALTRSFLVQYVIAREAFDADSVQSNYRKVGLWSVGTARDQYIASMGSANPTSPLAALPRGATIDVAVRSISSLNENTAFVRFTTTQTSPGGQQSLAQDWVATINFRYTDAEMSGTDRLDNPLGFQVTRYRKEAETLPQAVSAPPAIAPAALQPAPLQPSPATRVVR
jgi:type IV secretion system protein VirB8